MMNNLPQKDTIKCYFWKNIAFYLLFSITFFIPIIGNGDEKAMRPIYSFEGLKLDVIPKQEYKVKDDLKYGVFNVPIDNSIGVNSLKNAFSLLTFKKKKLSYKTVKKGFSKWVGGDCEFLPIFSREYIGWAQMRRFLLFNLKDKSHQYYGIRAMPKRWENIRDVQVLDGENKKFVFEIESHPGGGKPSEYYLKIYDFSGKKPKTSTNFLLQDTVLPQRSLAAVYRGIIFLFNENNKLEAYTEDLKQTHHPMVDLYNNNSDIDDEFIDLFDIHPTLPFAVICGETKLWVFSWKNDQPEEFPIAYSHQTGMMQYFSPDGKWIVLNYRDYDKKNIDGYSNIESNQVILMPVNENLPYFLDHPIRMSGHNEGIGVKRVWTTNPLSFNVVSSKKLIRWVIDNPHQG